MIRVLFVCTGNICRSPTGEAVLKAKVAEAGLADRIQVDSAGITAYHIGEAPDARSRAAARPRGYSMDGQKARQVEKADFEGFDYILALDRGHFRTLHRACPEALRDRIHMLMDFAIHHAKGGDVPDPYYGAEDGFNTVLTMVEDACDGLLADLKARL
ncbi:MAG: low molecular weight phosphotyrosine protein phosphatase [Rhodospirillum sp.]|nr:low molecular weight phosphotyrosine protein phosphatase [Rhodospirillum sp.]MCF8487870.1 low molecular weight phosphotyrosine protein phosphatase [Rhodospirillum sp.]MCF8499192.1 low molecular weight phosphotyrosine protein phosphatase [Rhodospirillum sp.]